MIAVSVGDVQLEPERVWAHLRESQNLLITSEGRPLALMISVERDDPEEMLSSLRLLRAQKAVERMRAVAAQKRLTDMTLAEINQKIVLARTERRPKSQPSAPSA